MLMKREGILGKVKSCLADFKAGRHETAIATLMSAIDATAAKTYPEMTKVGERFTKFLAEEIAKNLGGKYISVVNDLRHDYRGGGPVGDHIGAIYHLCRCCVLHQESYSEKIEFEITGNDMGIRIREEGGKLFFNEGFLNAMLHAVIYAEKNKDIFTDEVSREELAPLAKCDT